MIKKIVLCILLLNYFGIFSQSEAVKSSGDVLLYVMPAAALGTTLINGDKEGSWQFLKGFALNGITTVSLKFIIKKERPDMSNNNSFPSGHTSTTFQSAAFIQKRYGWKFGIPAYALASYCGITRLNANKHDFIDVFSGALIGVGSAYLFTTPYQKEHMELTFSKSESFFLIGYRFKF